MTFIPTFSDGRREALGQCARLYIAQSGTLKQRRRLTFMVSTALMNRLHWQLHERVTIAVGVDENLGQFQFTRTSRRNTGAKLLPFSPDRSARLMINLPLSCSADVLKLLETVQSPCEMACTIKNSVLVASVHQTTKAASMDEPSLADSNAEPVVAYDRYAALRRTANKGAPQ